MCHQSACWISTFGLLNKRPCVNGAACWILPDGYLQAGVSVQADQVEYILNMDPGFVKVCSSQSD